MKRDPLLKLYDKAEPEALAALMVGACLRLDSDQAEAILTAVPRKSYICPDVRYLWRRESLTYISMSWALDYWQTFAHCMFTSALILATPKAPLTEIVALDEVAKRQRKRLAALNAALNVITDETGLDVVAVRSFASVAGLPLLEIAGETDPDLVAEIAEGYRALLRSHGVVG